MPKPKTAIILLGGGMRSAHGAGFLYALATKLGITSPDCMIGSSGDAGNVLYFASGQYESLKRIWCELLSTPDFISFARPWKIMDVDYLIDTVFKQQEPLDVAALAQTRIKWFVPVTNFDTGASRYVVAADNLDPFEVLRAGKAIPVFFGKRISLFGGRYFDGELGPTLEDHVRFVISKGAERIVVVSHVSLHTAARQLLMRICTSLMPKPTYEAIMRDISTEAACLTIPGAEILCVIPQNLSAGIVTRNKAKLCAAFERGMNDALAIEKELRTLFT